MWLSELDFDVVHLVCVSVGVADALSRLPMDGTKTADQNEEFLLVLILNVDFYKARLLVSRARR